MLLGNSPSTVQHRHSLGTCFIAHMYYVVMKLTLKKRNITTGQYVRYRLAIIKTPRIRSSKLRRCSNRVFTTPT
jgi:hypothetical protein